MSIKLTPGVDFTNILHKAFMHTGPKSKVLAKTLMKSAPKVVKVTIITNAQFFINTLIIDQHLTLLHLYIIFQFVPSLLFD